MTTMEPLVAALAKEFTGETLALPLPRVDYADAMERFGVDRPDLRYGMEIKDVADLAALTDFKVFQQARESGHRIRGLCAPGGGTKYSRKDLDGLTEFSNSFGTRGLVMAEGRGGRPDRARPPNSSQPRRNPPSANASAPARAT